MKCVECEEIGHLKCTSVRRSQKIKLNFRVKTEIVVQRLTEEQESMSSDGEGESLSNLEPGCSACGSKRHDVNDCNQRGNNRYVQYENVRAKFARDASWNYGRSDKRDHHYGNRDRRQDSSRHSSSRHSDYDYVQIQNDTNNSSSNRRSNE